MSEQHADQILLVINKQAPSKKRFKQHADQIKFKFLSGDKNWKEYGGTWISQPFDSGEFEYYFIRNIINWNEHASEIEVKRLGKHNVSLWLLRLLSIRTPMQLCNPWVLKSGTHYQNFRRPDSFMSIVVE